MDIEKIISRIDRLKPVPSVGERIAAAMVDPEVSIKDIVDLVSYDPAITANLLRICNSAYFSRGKRIDSIKEAVTRLGLEKVACLVMMEGSVQNYRGGHTGYDLPAGQLWKYSVASAVLAGLISERCGFNPASLAFTAALLKDIGKVVLSDFVKDKFELINRIVHEKKITFLEAEKSVLGIDHAEIGAIAAEKWNFSSRMVDVIRFHHDPFAVDKPHEPLYIVHVADCICMMMGIGGGADGLAYRYSKKAVQRLGLDEEDLFRITMDFHEKLMDVEELVKLSSV